MRTPRIIFLLFMISILTGITAAQYTGSITTDEVENFTINDAEHSIELNYVDGGAKITVDDSESKYVRPLNRDSYDYGLANGDRFITNGINVEVRNVGYSSSSEEGFMRFTAYPENETKRIEVGQEHQINIDGDTHVLALKYVDGGAAVKLDDNETELGEELQPGDTFSSGSIGIEAVNSDYENNKGYLQYQITDETQEEPGLGRLKAECAARSSPEMIEYTISVPDASNYRNVDIFATTIQNGEETTIMQYGEILEEGRNTGERAIQTDLAEGQHEIQLEVVHHRSGKLEVECGTLKVSSDDENNEKDEIRDASISIIQEDGLYRKFSTNAEARGGLERISWDFDNDERYDKSGRTVSHTFQSPGEKIVTLHLVGKQGETETVSKTIKAQKDNGSSNETRGEDEVEKISSISLNISNLHIGDSVKIEITVPSKHAQKGYRTVVKNSEGKAVWQRTGERTENTYIIETDSQWTPGDYTVEVLPPQGLLNSVIEMISGSKSLTREEFRLSSKDVGWKTYCEEQGHDINKLQHQIACIEEKIVPTYFQSPVPEDVTVAKDLCQDLMGYQYSREKQGCVTE